MQAFSLEPATTEDPVRGMIVQGVARLHLHNKLMARADHYGRLAVAKGDDWTAVLISEDTDIALPWLPNPPMFLYALAPTVYCQMQYRPNVPQQFWPSLIAKLRTHAAVQTAFALTTAQIYDLSNAAFLADLTEEALL